MSVSQQKQQQEQEDEVEEEGMHAALLYISNVHWRLRHIRRRVYCARRRCRFRNRCARHAIEAKCETRIRCAMDGC